MKAEQNSGLREFSEISSRSKRISQLSITEKALNERQIVRKLLQKSRRQCLSHTHQAIASDTKIYRQCDTFGKKERASLPVKRNKKVFKNIYKQITEAQRPWETVKSVVQNRPQNSQVETPVQPRSERYPSTNTRSISLSGLTTYNFSSIKARHRLAFNPHAAEQEVQHNIDAAQQKAHAANERSLKIHMRTQPDEASQKKEMDGAITHQYPQLKTTAYLRGLQKWRDENQVIYGEKQKHISLKSEYMGSENQQQAEYMVQQIHLSLKKGPTLRRKSQVQRVKRWRRCGDNPRILKKY